MIGSRQYLFDTIQKLLSDQVLVELSPKTWIAANIRACITLLAYLEDMISIDESALREMNGEMHVVFQTLAVKFPPWIKAETRLKIEEKTSRALDVELSVEALVAQNDRFKKLLVEIIRQQGAAVRYKAGDDDFTKSLRHCLSVINELEFSVTKRAAKLQPF